MAQQALFTIFRIKLKKIRDREIEANTRHKTEEMFAFKVKSTQLKTNTCLKSKLKEPGKS